MKTKIFEQKCDTRLFIVINTFKSVRRLMKLETIIPNQKIYRYYKSTHVCR